MLDATRRPLPWTAAWEAFPVLSLVLEASDLESSAATRDLEGGMSRSKMSVLFVVCSNRTLLSVCWPWNALSYRALGSRLRLIRTFAFRSANECTNISLSSVRSRYLSYLPGKVRPLSGNTAFMGSKVQYVLGTHQVLRTYRATAPDHKFLSPIVEYKEAMIRWCGRTQAISPRQARQITWLSPAGQSDTSYGAKRFCCSTDVEGIRTRQDRPVRSQSHVIWPACTLPQSLRGSLHGRRRGQR